MHKHTNHLIHETSPYLLQHAHNPVNWYPWGEEALQKAKTEDKPILVSIGYAACHWCHVMERESFEDETTAGIMNEHFVNIKIDREERPDIDHIYMDAVQAMTGSGGWPLNVFLTPDAKPFYGGTYFPPRRAFNRASWQEVLQSVAMAFKEKRNDIDAQAHNLTEHLVQSNSFGLQTNASHDQLFSKNTLQQAAENIMKSADGEWGGFGKAPKFPHTFVIQFLLRYYHVHTGQVSGTSKMLAVEKEWQDVLHQATLSLDKMINGGIYDQAGGGFARYSTDTEWLVPHFEKMLYDNALLVSVLSEAYQLTGNMRYREVIDETIAFVQREMLHPQNGFYAAIDADSEGEEGKFYVWTIEEVKQILGKDAAIFCRYFDITERGNWQEAHQAKPRNILRVMTPLHEFAGQQGMTVEALREILENGKQKLLEQRAGRIRPGLDDKIILGWNALMNSACSKAFMATGKESYRKLAIDNMQFLLGHFGTGQGTELFHTWKNGTAKYPAFLDDYAFLIEALIYLHEITADTQWLDKAAELTGYVSEQFSEAATGFFYYTKAGQADVIVRKKEVYDGAVPSGNAVMAWNLYRLSLLLDRPQWKERSITMVASIGQAVSRYPVSFGIWACFLQELVWGTYEIAVVGKEYGQLMQDLHYLYIPHRVFMGSHTEDQRFPLLAGKPPYPDTLIYLCKDYVCKQPVNSIKRFMLLIDKGEKDN